VFQEHLYPHQFGASTLEGYEAIHFGIQTFLDLHLDWAIMQVDIENTFNNLSRASIFRKLCDVGGLLANIVPFTKLFYGAHFFLLPTWATCEGGHHY
jgi:hypothetical protein